MRDLGIILDKQLTFVPHIENIIARGSKILGFIIRNGKIFRNHKTKIVLYYSLVRSLLEYGSIVWRPHYAAHTLRLERIQKRFLWHLSFSVGMAKKLPSYKDRLAHFKIITLENRRNVLDLIFTYKVLRNRVNSAELLSKFKIKVPYRYPRHKIVGLLQPPFRKSVMGYNSAIPRLCRLHNEYSSMTDVWSDSLFEFRGKILEGINQKESVP